MIDKKISLSEKVASLQEGGMLLYTWMIPHADDFGLLQGSARTIKALVVPMLDWSVQAVTDDIQDMIRVGLVEEVVIKGKKYYRITDFDKNQIMKKTDRQPQTIMDVKLHENHRESWKSCENLLLESIGIQSIPDGSQRLPDSIVKDSILNYNIGTTMSSVEDLSHFLKIFNSLFKSKYQETDGRKKKLATRLKIYTFDQIITALKNLSESKFHQGDNDRGWKADPDFLLRSDEQIDKWLNNTGEAPTSKVYKIR